jgi:copper resistance protein B
MKNLGLLTICCAIALPLTASEAVAQMAPIQPNAAAPYGVEPVNDERIYYHALLDEFEGRFGGGGQNFRWDGEAWAGTDTNRLWLKSEGEVENGVLSDGQQEVLYDRPFSSYFDFQGGVRTDLDSRPGRTWAAFGVEGFAPYYFHVSATGYASSSGHYAAKLQASYEQLLTQRLILEPQIEINLYTKDDPRRLVGSGLSDIDTGLRLRYEITRKFAPYIGVSYESKFGNTADFVRSEGEKPSALRFTVGVRAWF